MSIRHIASLAVLAVLIAGCSDEQSDDLARNRNLWSSKGLVGYEYSCRWSCFCPSDMGHNRWVTVQFGQVIAVREYRGGPLIEPPDTSHYSTIDRLFEKIDAALSRQEVNVNVTYDPNDGHPRTFNVSYGDRVLDGDYTVTIDSLVPLL